MTKTIQNNSITIIIVITITIALLGLSSVFITNQEALAADHPREIPDRGYVGGNGVTIDCTLNRNIPADPLIVDIQETVDGFFTVIMEKEISDCTVTPSGESPFPVIIQDTLLITYTESRTAQLTGKGIVIKLISCEKDLEFTHLGPLCFNFGSPAEFINELDCSGDAGFTEAFVDMDSASYNWFQKFNIKKVTVKTVIVEKEIFDCFIFGTGTPRIAEVYTIEEMKGRTVLPFLWVVCEKDSDLGILGCITSETVIPL